MGNESPKSIEQLRDKVHSGLELLSDEELNVLFQDAEQITQGTPTTPQETPIEPSVAPVKVEAAPLAAEPSKGQADLMSLVPEKFRDKDEAASLAKMTKALQDSEAELTRRSQELSQLHNVVQELSRKPREEYQSRQSVMTTPTKTVEEPEVEIDDMSFLDSPAQSAIKIAKKVAEEVARRVSIEQIKEYDTFATRRRTFESFLMDHKDFNNYRVEFAEACRLHPEWDNDINGLPKLYDLAKQIAAARAMTPTQQPGTPQTLQTPVIDVEKLKAEIKAEVEASSFEKARQAILEEIKRRKAAGGTIPSGPSSLPQDRITSSSRTVPLTEEEKIFKDMMDAGPQNLKELGPYADILNLTRAGGGGEK